MHRIADKLNARGIRTFCMDLRGTGPGYRLAARPGHAGRSEDTAAAVNMIHQLSPKSPLTAVGFSMGGNILLKMLGERRIPSDVPLDSCLAIAPPIDILSCSLNMLRPINRVYSMSFARSLMKQVQRRRPFVDAMRQIPLQPKPANLLEFDDRFTAPLSGFRDARDYYARCSSKDLLRHIAISTLILTASDDPMIPAHIFAEATYSPTTRLVVTQGGGHLGFIGVPGVDPDLRWMDWRIIDWIERQAKRID